jgi:hypothetical protein
MNFKYKLIGVSAVFLIAAQFMPYGKDHANPPVVAEPRWDSPKTRKLFFRACGDCHSNETRWPVYSAIAPMSWLIHHDVHQGRREFNVSLWGVREKNEGDESIKAVWEGEMPPWFYVIPNPEARLSGNDRQEFIMGLLGTFGKGNHDDEHEDE